MGSKPLAGQNSNHRLSAAEPAIGLTDGKHDPVLFG
jgi:hypothetical protein